jgi:pyruvate kinase
MRTEARRLRRTRLARWSRAVEGAVTVVAFTESGITARLLSLHRPRVPVVAITHEDRVYRQLALSWGVVPVKSEFVENTDDLLAAGEERLKARGFASRGDTILMLSGHSPAAAATNMLRVHTVS